MSTYGSTPGKYRNGKAYGDAKTRDEAGETKRRARVCVIQDEWRRTHPRKIDAKNKGREVSGDHQQRERNDAPQP